MKAFLILCLIILVYYLLGYYEMSKPYKPHEEKK